MKGPQDIFFRPLRIACYGYAQPDAGSGSSGIYMVLKELLARGHQIDFFGKPSFAYPAGLEAFPNFRYVNTEGRAERWFGRGTTRGPGLTRRIAGMLTHGQTCRNVPAAIAAENRRRHYDVCFYAGLWALGRAPNAPTVAWVQGAPGSDAASIARRGAEISRLEGRVRYAALRLYAAYRQTFGRPSVEYTDVVMSGSQWSVDKLRPLVPSNVPVVTLAYPMDLERFKPEPAVPKAAVPTVLWAGRTVPRKRLDLYLDACERIIASGRPLKVQVIGGFAFVPGYRRLMDRFRYPEHLEYRARVSRDVMPDIFRRASLLVQPSEDEDFGTAVAESLACGTPVVVGPTNGTAAYIGDGGVRFDRYEADDVAAAIVRALDGIEADADAWSARARTAAEEHFELHKIADRLVSIFRQAAGMQAGEAARAGSFVEAS